MPKVSIVTPCYNSAEFLEVTFKAVTSQSFTDWEWLLVDDQSSDDTFKMLEVLQSRDKRIKIFRNIENSGASFSRNRGIDNASGELIAFLDADDLWNVDKLKEQISFMDNESTNFSFHNYDMIDVNGSYLKTVTAPETVSNKTLEKFNPIFTSSVMIRKSAISDIRFKLELRRRQDYIFWYQVVRSTGPAKNVNKNLGQYRVGNENSLSHNKFRAAKIQWQIYREQFGLSYLGSIKSLSAYALHGITKYFL